MSGPDKPPIFHPTPNPQNPKLYVEAQKQDFGISRFGFGAAAGVPLSGPLRVPAGLRLRE